MSHVLGLPFRGLSLSLGRLLEAACTCAIAISLHFRRLRLSND